MSMPVKHDHNDMHKHYLSNESNVLQQMDTYSDTHQTTNRNNSSDNELGLSYHNHNHSHTHMPYHSSLDESVVDDLVSTLTHKLCLKSKSCHSVCKHNRMSPYNMHNAITKSCLCLNCKYLANGGHNIGKQRSQPISDPYELMQELLKEGALIKEAVKRLQLNSERDRQQNSNKVDYYDYSDEDFGVNENEINLLNS